jgi:desulfoferrodoxin (superoxide reductase-like protein)
MQVNKPGKLVSLSWCNAHGLWEDEKEIKLAE